MGGQVPLMIDTVTAVRPHVAFRQAEGDRGDLVQGPTELLPGVKPVAEQGLPGFEVIAWNALYAPKGTPRDVVDKLNVEINKILAQPETRQKLKDLGLRRGRRLGGAARGVRARRAQQVGTAHQERRHEGGVSFAAAAMGPSRQAGRSHGRRLSLGAALATAQRPETVRNNPRATETSRSRTIPSHNH